VVKALLFVWRRRSPWTPMLKVLDPAIDNFAFARSSTTTPKTSQLLADRLFIAAVQ